MHAPSSPSHPSRSPLRCLPDCPCRCHSPSVHRLIPTWLAYYIGQISISKRLLRPPWSSWSLCDEQTCRGDLQRALIVQWVLPTGFLHGSFQSSKDRRIHFLIGAPRVVRWDSPIFNALQVGDLKGVRYLFATGQASIWDYSMNGMPVFYVSGFSNWVCSLSVDIVMYSMRAIIGKTLSIPEKTGSISSVSSSRQVQTHSYMKSKPISCSAFRDVLD